ncbi:MAG: hypothetical protein NVSMB5_14110 [Candidatus Velthaea sp.]
MATGSTIGYAAVRLVQALRDRRAPLGPVADREASAYAAARRGLMLAGIGRSTASLAVSAFVVADPLDRVLQPLPRLLRGPAFVVALTILDTLRDWPADYVESHVMERRYGMSDQSAGAWAKDHLKGALVGLLVASVLAVLGDVVVRRAPRTWPYLAIGITPALLALANVIAPTFIMPLFNKYTPLEGDLERRIRALAERYGVGNASILRFDMSRQTKKANAFVTGVFGTERIAIADTLLEHFEDDETLFVVAHELGHYVRRDPWISIGLGTAFLGATILAGNSALRASGRPMETAADGTRFAFYASLVATLGSPLMAAASRAIERRADRFAIAATNDPQSGAHAFRRLRDQNLAEDEAPKWAELLFASHPSLKSRIERLEAAGAQPVRATTAD